MRRDPVKKMPWAVVLVLTLLASAWAQGPSEGTDVRERIEHAACRLIVRDALGVPLAYGSGFAMGAGRFVIADLSTIARPGVASVDITFGDGTTVRAAQFGTADADLNVVLLKVTGEEHPTGLKLPARMPKVKKGGETAVAAWFYGEEFAFGRGYVGDVVSTTELAREVGVDRPGPPRKFVTFKGLTVTGGTGGAVVNNVGEVLGLEVEIGREQPVTILVPAPFIRQSILSSQPELKPLSELPDPAWPTPIRRVPGRPPISKQVYMGTNFSRFLDCTTCGGDGEVVVKVLVGYEGAGAYRRPVLGREKKACERCDGEGVRWEEGDYKYYRRAANVAARYEHGATATPQVRRKIRFNTQKMLERLAQGPPGFLSDFIVEAGVATDRLADNVPAGVVLLVQVGPRFTGPAGEKYVLLGPAASATSLVVRVAAVERLQADAPGRPNAEPIEKGQWIAMAGLADTVIEYRGRTMVHVLPATWVEAPGQGYSPALADLEAPAEVESTENREDVDTGGEGDGEVDFFGS